MAAQLPENERLRNEIKILTDAIENAKTKHTWQRRKREHSFHLNQPKLDSRTNIQMSKYARPIKERFNDTSYNVHPYTGGFASNKIKKMTGWEHFRKNKDTYSGSKHQTYNNLMSKSIVNASVQSSTYVDPSAGPIIESKTCLKKAQSDVGQEEFQQKVDKMKNTIAELQKALTNRLMSTTSSSSKPRSVTKQVPPRTPNHCDVSKTADNTARELPWSQTASINYLTKSINEPCLSWRKDNRNLLSESLACSNLNYKKPAKESSGSAYCDNYGEHKISSVYKDKSCVFFDSTSESQCSDSNFVSISKYKLARLKSSPSKLSTPVTDLINPNSTKPHCSELSRTKEYLQVKSNLKGSGSNFDTVKISSDTSKRSLKPFLLKSKYSMQRVKNNSKRGVFTKKTVSNGSQMPSKFISLSRYAIKRVRRSLSDETQTSSIRSPGDTLMSSRSKDDWSYCGASTKSYKPSRSIHALKHYKQVQSPRFRHEYKVINYYHKKYCFPYKHQFHSQRAWKHIRNLDDKMYRQGWKDRHYTYGTRYGQPVRYHQVSRYNSWYPNCGSKHDTWTRYQNRKIQRLKHQIPFNPKHKLDRRNISKKDGGDNFVLINGLLYKKCTKKLVNADPATIKHGNCAETNTLEKSMKILPSDKAPSIPGMINVTLKDMKTVTVRGVKFKVDKLGKSLTRIAEPGAKEENSTRSTPSQSGANISRIDIGGVTYMQTKPGTLEKVHSVKSRVAAVRVVNKTLQRAAGKYKKDNTKISRKKKYCMFYNRFGKCNRKDKCPFIHDPDKIAVCTRFLRGTCKSNDCPFSHKVSGNKIPTCSFFMMGKCSRKDCPYPHVNVNKEAAVCEEFLKGFCPSGVKCKKKHILQCMEYFYTGICSNGEKCKLQHKKTKGKKQPEETRLEPNIVSTSGPVSLSNEVSEKNESTSLNIIDPAIDNRSEESAAASEECVSSGPLCRKRKLPAYISLKTHYSPVVESDLGKTNQRLNASERSTLKIRPQFV